MRKLVVSEFVTLGGVMQGPGSPDEDREGGFEHGGWKGPYFDDIQMQAVRRGHRRYRRLPPGPQDLPDLRVVLAHQPAGDPFADTLDGLPEHVVSRTLTEPSSGTALRPSGGCAGGGRTAQGGGGPPRPALSRDAELRTRGGRGLRATYEPVTARRRSPWRRGRYSGAIPARRQPGRRPRLGKARLEPSASRGDAWRPPSRPLTAERHPE